MKALSSVLVALSLLVSSGAVLADHDHDDQGHDRGHGYAEHHDRDDHRDRDDRRGGYDRDYRRGGGDWDHHRDDRRYYGVRYDRADRYYAGPRHWERGVRYDGPMYIVNDYVDYRLAPPPYGYRWVRDDRSYVLVSIGDNMILDVAIR
ncbi:RcnB family protein [Dyella halodurans]|uniref:RcnB family protein n=1 Tax=Dyella halodurans TaxID=1920171 RepID=A0ABV9BZ98_9GAMM|nr:RcnB family protein [Dyella halodurans]